MNNPLFFTLLLLTSYGGYDKIYLERRNVMSIRTIKRDIKYWFQRRIRGWSDDETWNLDYEFIKWVNSRFKKYKEGAIGTVDLEYHKFKYKRKEYTQLQLIDRVIELTDEMLTDEYWDLMCTDAGRLKKNKDEVFDIFKLIYGVMWW